MQLAGQFERRAETRSGRVLCHLCVVWCSDYGVRARVLRDGGYVMHGAPDFTPCLHRISGLKRKRISRPRGCVPNATPSRQVPQVPRRAEALPRARSNVCAHRHACGAP